MGELTQWRFWINWHPKSQLETEGVTIQQYINMTVYKKLIKVTMFLQVYI